jgi:putative acetyltransferase
MIRIAIEDPDQPPILTFLAAHDVYVAELYPAESSHLLDVEALRDPAMRFHVMRDEAGTALGCGVIRLDPEGYAEVARMWIDPDARGMGLGRRMLQALEACARAEGMVALRLETGVAQPEAIALYRSAGFAETAPFGGHPRDSLSVFLEKRLGG